MRLPTARHLLGVSLATALLSGSAAQAAEGLPQLNPESFAPQLFWGAIAFGALYLIVSRLITPRVGAVLEERRDRVRADLERAQELRAEAESVLQAYEQKLADAREETRKLDQASHAAIAEAAREAQDRLSHELAEQTAAAEARIAAAREEAVANIRSIAVDTAEAIVTRLTDETADQPAIAAEVDNVMQERAA